jgi:hypothetical protein
MALQVHLEHLEHQVHRVHRVHLHLFTHIDYGLGEIILMVNLE